LQQKNFKPEFLQTFEPNQVVSLTMGIVPIDVGTKAVARFSTKGDRLAVND